MTDPVMTGITVALVNKAIDGLSEAGKAAFAALRKLVRRKLAARESSKTALERAEAEPDEDAYRLAVTEALTRAAAEDRLFAAQVQQLWRAVQEAKHAGAVRNSVSGTVSGHVVQVRDIRGGVSFERQ